MQTDFRQSLTNEQRKAVDELTTANPNITISGVATRLGLTREYVQTYKRENNAKT